jgi:hypothetical protein
LAAVLLIAAVPARAGDVKVSFSNGLVTIVATDASPRQILAEWAKLGQVRITNLERLAGGPLTIQLTSVPEAQALETLLRGTAGYVAAPRQAAADVAVSRYDRILLMPGTAPALPAVTPASSSSGGINRGRPVVQPVEVPDDDSTEEPAPRLPPNMVGRGQRSGAGAQTPGQMTPSGQAPGQVPGYFSPYQAQPGALGGIQQPGAQTTSPANPMRSYPSPQLPPNATSSSVPGVTTAPMRTPATPYPNAGPPTMAQPDDFGNAGQAAIAPGASQPGAARPGDATAPTQQQFRNPYGIPDPVRPQVTDPYANPYGLPNPVRPATTFTPATTPGATTPGATTPGATTTTTGPIKNDPGGEG